MGPGRGINNVLFTELKHAGAAAKMVFAKIRNLYPTYAYADPVQHHALVLIPFQERHMRLMWVGRMAIEFLSQQGPSVCHCAGITVRVRG